MSLSAPYDMGYVTAEDVAFEVKDIPQLQTVTMEDDYTKIEVAKVDAETGDYVEGATLAVYPVDEHGNAIEGECFETFVSGKEPHVIERIPTGKYILRELSAPVENGYIPAKDIIFDVNDTPTLQVITMEDDFTKIEVSKQDITNGEELPGAHLKVMDADGNTVDEWVSTDKPHMIKYLIPEESYTLVETLPADGYTTATNVDFRVEATGDIQQVVMYDDITKIEISKQDITDGEELPGAHLKVVDEAGNTVDEWISTDTPHYIEKLTAGKTYTLIETLPADGYTTAADIEFTVKDTWEIQKVTMKDDITTTEFHKVNEDGDMLEGATLQVIDKDGNIVDEWVSSNNPHVIEKLIVGQTYTLTEINAPDGYSKAKDIKFTVEDTSGVQKVVMTDVLKVGKLVPFYETPKTGDHVNPIAIFNWMMICGGTAAFILLAKKNHKKEDK